MTKKKDTVLVGPPISDKGHHLYLRASEDHTSVGVLGPHDGTLPTEPEGHMSLSHVAGPIYDVEESYVYNCTPKSSDGPPKVTSNNYRKGWNNIFGKKQVTGQA